MAGTPYFVAFGTGRAGVQCADRQYDVAMVKSCLFCRIVAGDLAAGVVAKNEHAFAFRDVNPVAPTHVLVVPRQHIANAQVVSAADATSVAAMFELSQEVARIEGVDETGYRLVFNVGDDSGNSVAHLHMHVIGGQSMGWPPFVA